MKTVSKAFSILLVFFIFTYFSHSQAWMQGVTPDKSDNFIEVQKQFNSYWQDKKPAKGTGYKQFRRWEYFWQQRLGDSGKFPNNGELSRIMQSVSDAKTNSKQLLGATADWHELGPVNRPVNKLSYQSSGLGRITCVRFNPQNDNIIFVGSASGGIWRSTDAGASWTALPMTSFLSLAISDIAISPSNPNVIYAGTADPNGYTMSRGYSIGIIKSTDGGNSWLASGLASQISDNFLIGAVLVNPSNPNIVIAATSSGIYKTTDGGANWNLKKSGVFFRDLKFQPANPNVIYASSFSYGGNAAIWTSSDGGDSWNSSKSFSGVSRIALAVTPSDQSTVAALCVNYATQGFAGFWISTNAGTSWTQKSAAPNILNINDDGSGSDGQGSYDLACAISPVNKNEIYTGGIQVWKSTDGGVTWALKSEWMGIGKPFMHADQHDLVFNSQNVLYAGNDGGIYKSMDNGDNWTDISDGLSIQQYYRMSGSLLNPYLVLAGSQDNGTQLLNGSDWSHIDGGDGMQAIIDYSSDNIMYASMPNGYIQQSLNGCVTFNDFLSYSITKENSNWVTPFVLHPTNPDTLFAAYKNVWKVSRNGLYHVKISSFTGNRSLECLAAAPNNPNILYTSAGSKLYWTSDGGKTLTWPTLYTADGTITSITVDPLSAYHIWITISGYTAGSKVYEYKSGNWSNISGSLPNVPANTFAYVKDVNKFFIGTDVGVYSRDISGTDWSAYNSGMPNLIISQLEYSKAAGMLRAATFGRGIWETKLVNCSVAQPAITFSGDTSFCTGDSLTLSSNNNYAIYKWSTGQASKSIVVASSGDYSLSVADANGCAAAAAPVHVTVYTPPALKITSPRGNKICIGDTVIISASPGFSEYSWNTGDAQRTAKITRAGSFVVTGITSTGCPAISDTFRVQEYEKPDKPTITISNDTLIASPATRYEWYHDGNSILGAYAQFYVPTESGSYYVIVSDTNNCSSASDVLVLNTLVEDAGQALPVVNIIPNPTGDIVKVTIAGNPAARVSIQLTNMLGILMESRSMSSSEGINFQVFDLTGYAAGLYFLIVDMDGQVTIERIIKE